jgi:hypothetical protein
MVYVGLPGHNRKLHTLFAAPSSRSKAQLVLPSGYLGPRPVAPFPGGLPCGFPCGLPCCCSMHPDQSGAKIVTGCSAPSTRVAVAAQPSSSWHA